MKLQFSLRTLMIAVTLFAVACAAGVPALREWQASALKRELEGRKAAPLEVMSGPSPLFRIVTQPPAATAKPD